MRQLFKLNDLKGFSLKADDGEIGSVRQIYFNDQSWLIRYLVVRTGPWLFGKDVLIVPLVVQSVDEKNKRIEVDLTREQIKSCPPIDKKLPVSRHYEQQYYDYYGWEPYWINDPLYDLAPKMPPSFERTTEKEPEHPHLRSSEEVTGYHLQAKDDKIGHITDFILDDHDWAVRYLEIDTKNWLPGRKVLVSTPWIKTIDWPGQKVSVELSRERIQTAPEYDSSKIISRDYELTLYKHYGRTFDQS